MHLPGTRISLFNTLIALILIALIAGSGVILMRTPGSGRQGGEQPSGDSLSVTVKYPEDWNTGLQEALSSAKFELPIPATPEANEENAKEVYLSPSGTTFALVYENPTSSPGVELGHEDLEVYAEPFSLSVSPLEAWQSDAKLVGDSASVRKVHGVDALVIEPLGESDAERDNPAFVRFVLDGVDISVHGGTDLDLILRIAESVELR